MVSLRISPFWPPITTNRTMGQTSTKWSVNIATPTKCSSYATQEFFQWYHATVYFGLSPLPVTVTTRIITFLVGNPYKPSFVTVTGRGDNPRYISVFGCNNDFRWPYPIESSPWSLGLRCLSKIPGRALQDGDGSVTREEFGGPKVVDILNPHGA